MSQGTIIVYFGCWDRPGHFLWNQNKQWVSDRDIERLLLPTAGTLDGSRLFLPYPEKVGAGAVTYLPAPDRTVLAWWGLNLWDQRGAVNSAIITNGNLDQTEMWQRFAGYFPELAEKLTRPVTY